jgi:hypothetical protein
VRRVKMGPISCLYVPGSTDQLDKVRYYSGLGFLPLLLLWELGPSHFTGACHHITHSSGRGTVGLDGGGWGGAGEGSRHLSTALDLHMT